MLSYAFTIDGKRKPSAHPDGTAALEAAGATVPGELVTVLTVPGIDSFLSQVGESQ